MFQIREAVPRLQLEPGEEVVVAVTNRDDVVIVTNWGRIFVLERRVL